MRGAAHAAISSARDSWDHPRVCGEQHITPAHAISSTGSPPRVRGAVLASFLGGVVTRITPACAGSRFACSLTVTVIEDHPRVCGEQRAQHSYRALVYGSPPRVRGADHHLFYRTDNARITPACAGSRWLYGGDSGRAGDHPRVCGEQLTLPT